MTFWQKLRNGPFVIANNYLFYLKVGKLWLLSLICIEKQGWQSTCYGGFKNRSSFFWLFMKHSAKFGLWLFSAHKKKFIK